MTDDRPCRWCPFQLSQDAESLCPDCASKEAMLKEGLTTVPERLTREDFDRFLWKLAVYATKGMERQGERLRWTLEHMRNSLALPIVEALPLNYVSVIKDAKWAKSWKPGMPAKEVVFTIKTAIPKALLFKTLERLKIWQPIKKDEPDDFTGA